MFNILISEYDHSHSSYYKYISVDAHFKQDKFTNIWNECVALHLGMVFLFNLRLNRWYDTIGIIIHYNLSYHDIMLCAIEKLCTNTIDDKLFGFRAAMINRVNI